MRAARRSWSRPTTASSFGASAGGRSRSTTAASSRSPDVRALKYFVTEAAASLWRGRRSALLAVLTIAAGLFVLGFFLIVNTNVRQLTTRWAESAELAVFL